MQHKLAKWLISLLQLVLEKYSVNCVKNSVIFVSFMPNHSFSSYGKFMCMFVIINLFICVSLQQTIDICTVALYCSNLYSNYILEGIFIELMKFAIMSMKFIFNKNIYRQLYGIAMGSPLGPMMANILIIFISKIYLHEL